MSPFRPPRVRGFSYVGAYRYFLTVRSRRRAFVDPAQGRSVIAQLLPISKEERFAIVAYCVMPDHAHIVAEGEAETSDLRLLMTRWKQVTGYDWQQRTGVRLWQEGYYDHVLRDDEDLAAVVRYVLDNPVRAGLAESPADYPLLGSDRYSLSELADVAADWLPPHRRRG